jgi:hypothetical protein
MIIRRDALFAGVLTLTFAGFGCSSSKNSSNPDTDAGSSTTGTGGKSGTGGAGAAGKSGTGGAGGKSGAGGAGGAGGKSGAGGAGGAGGASGSGAPSIKIDAPAEGASLGPTATYPDYPDVPVKFTVKNFTLMAPGSNMPAGTCAAGVCGHVHLLVDGTACNDTASHVPYNAAGAASPINAGLDYCPKIDGAHVISLELHNDDHSAVKDSGGTVISDKINVTAALPNEGDAG